MADELEQARAFGKMEGDVEATLRIVRRLETHMEDRMDKLDSKFNKILVTVALIASSLGVGGGMIIP